MKLELKESNSPYWLLGIVNGKLGSGSDYEKPCYYKSSKKQYELAKRMIDASVNPADEVYAITGVQWDNMKGSWSMKETVSYIKSKGELIASKFEITKYAEKYDNVEESTYPKGISRDPLPKKGVKVYTSPATALEDKGENKKMKLELKETREKYIFNSGDSKEDWGNNWELVKKLDGEECIITDLEQMSYDAYKPKDFEEKLYTIKFNDGTILEDVFGKYLTPVLKENIVSVDDIPQDLQDRFFTTMADGRPELFKKFTKDELKLFADFVKQLPEQEVTDLERNLLLYAISMAHGDDLTVESIIKSVNKESSKKVEEGATKLEKGEGDTFKNSGTTWKVIKQNAEDTLVVALDKDGNEKDRYVVAWGLQKDNSWNQGHYFTDRDEAMKYFNKREKKQESLKESNNNEYSVKYNVGDVVKFIHAGNKESDETATITGYDNEGFYKVKWPDGKESEGLHDKNLKLVSKSDLKESKIVTPVGNPQTAGSFVNIDVDLDHMEVSDFIVRLAQAIRSEQTAILEYVALTSANGITNEDRAVIEGIMKEEKNHMCALTVLLYKQILMNHKENVDEANDEFTLPKFGADIFDENNKLTESISNVLNKIITESSHDGTYDEYTVGDRESTRIYNGLSNTLNVIKNIISTSDEEVVVQNVTLSDTSKTIKESIMTTDDLINELKTDTNYDEIAYHIHEYSKTDKNKAMELMDLLFELEDNKSPKECRNEIINHLTITEDTKITPKDSKYSVEIDVEYDSDVANQIFSNIAREVEEYNKNNEINLSDLGLQDGKFYFTVNKEIDEQMVKDICDEIFDKATNYEYQIVIA